MIVASSSFAVALFAALVVLLLCILLAKKFYYLFAKKKRYFIVPRVGVTGMMNVAMVIAIAVSLIILIMSLSGGVAGVFFRAYPGTRVTVEVILVKISGLLFGPIIGMVSGALIDLLAIALSAGFFHYGYFLAAILTGLVAGVLRSMTAMPKVHRHRDLLIAVYATVFVALSAALTVGILAFARQPGAAAGLAQTGVSLSFKGTGVDIFAPLPAFLGSLIAFALLVVAVIWGMYGCWMWRRKAYDFPLTNHAYRTHRHANHKGRFWRLARGNWYSAMVNTVSLATASALVVNILFVPIYDAEITGQQYTFWLLFRALVAVALFVMDVAIIYPVLLVIMPIMKYNYEDELVEDLSMPLHYETWGKAPEDRETDAAIKACSETLLFSLNAAQLDALRAEFGALLDQFERVAAIDTEGVEPTHYPLPVSAHELRPDAETGRDAVENVADCAEMTARGLVRVY